MKSVVVIPFPGTPVEVVPRQGRVAPSARGVEHPRLRVVKPARLGREDVLPGPRALRTLQRGYDTAVRIARRAVATLRALMKSN